MERSLRTGEAMSPNETAPERIVAESEAEAWVNEHLAVCRILFEEYGEDGDLYYAEEWLPVATRIVDALASEPVRQPERRLPDPDCPSCGGYGSYIDREDRTRQRCGCIKAQPEPREPEAWRYRYRHEREGEWNGWFLKHSRPEITLETWQYEIQALYTDETP
jgi:hypothetical protein